MELIIWNTLIVIGKLAIYIGFASAIASVFQLLSQAKADNVINFYMKQRVTLSYICITCFIAILGTFIWFMAQTGAMAEEGIQGVLDPMMIEIMWDSSVGITTQLRLLAFVALTMISAYFLKSGANQSVAVVYISLMVFIASIFLLIYSFTLLGHTVELELIPKLIFVLHVVIFGWWFGALFSLWRKCKTDNYSQLYQEMESFGRQAAIVVPILLIAGGVLTYQLIGSISELIDSSYGRTLLLKLFVVTGVLTIAAYHKFKLVPALKQHKGREKLAFSIVIEMAFALTILLITSGLTSFLGPESLY